MNRLLALLPLVVLGTPLRAATPIPPEPAVALRDSSLVGDLKEDEARFTLTATARVKERKGASLELLSGNVALVEATLPPRCRVRFDDGRLTLVTERSGDFELRLVFNAAVRRTNGWSDLEFRVAPTPVQPILLRGLGEDAQFLFPGAARPTRGAEGFTSFLPPNGEVRLAWKEAKTEAEGKLFYAAEALSQISVSPGLMRQTTLLEFKIMQGELRRLALGVRGEGEVTRVQGAAVLSWTVEPGAETGTRRLVILFNQAQKEALALLVQLQTPLGTFPQSVDVTQLWPESATRFGGHVRIVNEGAVRLEVVTASGLSQISPDQIPLTETTRPLVAQAASQVFAYRFSGVQHQLRLQADNILPEISVSQILAYHLAETELTLEAEVELDIREAPLREVLLRLPRGYALARLNASGLSDYFVTDPPGQAQTELRLVYATPVSGRQVIQLRLERNQALGETAWNLPAFEVVKAKSVRGHVGVSADAGFRLTPAASSGLTDIATAYFPRQVAGIQAAFRLNDPAWQATLTVERLAQSIQTDAFHLFSIGEGIAYGSSVLNYLIAGAPVSTFRLELSDEYFNVEFVGKDIRAWQKIEGGYQVQLHTPVSGAYALLVTYERPFKAQGDTLNFAGARPLEIQSEQGHTLVISAYQFQVEPVNVSPALLPLEAGEVPPEYRLFFDAPILAAYRYAARPFNLRLQLKPLAQGETVNQVIDRALITTRISEEGQVLTDVRYFIKSKGQPHVRLTLPPATELWSAVVNDVAVVPVVDGQANLIPLPQRADPNTVNVLDLKLATQPAGARRLRVALPQVATPVLLAQWRLEPDAGQRLVYLKGSLAPTTGIIDASGFAGLRRLLTGGAGSTIVGKLLVVLGLLLVSGFVWRWTLGAAPHKYSLRHLAGTTLGLVAAGLAVVALVQLAHDARRGTLSVPPNLLFIIPVQQADSSVSVDVANLKADRAVTAQLTDAWPAFLALGLWLYASLKLRRGLRAAGWVLAWACLTWAALRWPNGMPAALLVIAAFAVLHWIAPWLRRLSQLPPKPAASVGTPAPGPAVGLLLAGLLLAPQPAQADEPPAVKTASAAVATNMAVADAVIQTVRVDNDYAAGEVLVRWNARKGQTLPLLSDSGVLTEIAFPERALRLAATDDRRGYQFIAERAGDFEIRLKYQARVTRREGDQGYLLPTQPGLVNRLDLTLVGADVDFNIPAAVTLRRTASEGSTNTVAEVVLAPARDGWIGWRPRRRDTSREKTVFYAELQQLLVPTAGVVEGCHHVQIRPAQGELTELTFEVPTGMTITDVLDATGGARAADTAGTAAAQPTPSRVALWRFDPDTRQLRITLARPQARSFALQIRSQRATTPLPYDHTAELVTVSSAAGQVGLVGLATGPDVQLDDVTATALTVINLEDFPTTTVTAMQPRLPGLALRRAYRYAENVGRLVLKAAPVEPDIRVESQQTLSLGEDRTLLAANLSVEITRAGIFKLSFLLPPGLDLESISGPALSHWTELKTDAGRSITLHLRGKTEGQQQFALTLAGPGVRATNGWLVPPLNLREAGKQRGQLVIVPEQGMRLQVGQRDNVLQLDPLKAGIRQKGVLAFRLLQSDWALRLDIERVDAWVQVTSLQDVTLTEAQVKVAANLQYQIENTGVKSLIVRLPAAAESVRFKGEQVADFVAREGPAGAATREWEVKLHRRIIGRYLLQVTYQLPLAAQATETRLLGVQAEDASLQRGFVTLRAVGRLQARLDRPPEALQPTEWQAIPKALQQDIEAGSANYAFRLVEPGFDLPVRLERHEAARLLPARVSQVTLTSVVSDDGVMLTQARLELVPGDKRLLHLTLPPDARFWFAFVNQNGVWPWRETNHILIPLEQHSKVGAATTVEFFYASPTAKAGARSLDLAVQGPQFDLPLENITWNLYLNGRWQVRDWSGSLQLKQQQWLPPTAAADLDTYLQTENTLQQAKIKEAEQLLSMANSYLGQGDPQQARRAFQAAYGLSQHDQAFNEDARVQLHNLKMQQALVGLNARQAAVAGEAAAPVARFRAQRGDRAPTYTQDEAKQLLERNTAEDNAVQMRLAERLVQQQEAALANPAAIRAAIPTQGRWLTFTRALQIDRWADLKISIEATAARATPRWLKGLALGTVLLVFGLLTWAGRRGAAA